MTVIETSRLILREMILEDCEVLAEVLCDPKAMHHYPKAFSLEEVSAWVERNQARYRNDGHGLWTVVIKETGEVIGDCGLTYQHVDGVDELEIGYHIIPKFWNLGYATEAAAACCKFAFENLSAKRAISWMNPENYASRRVAEKNGLEFEKETRDSHGRPSIVYSKEN